MMPAHGYHACVGVAPVIMVRVRYAALERGALLWERELTHVVFAIACVPP